MTKTEFYTRLRELKKVVESGKAKADTDAFREALLIIHTGKDSKGGSFNTLGQMNQAAWVGENCATMILELEHLRSVVNTQNRKRK